MFGQNVATLYQNVSREGVLPPSLGFLGHGRHPSDAELKEYHEDDQTDSPECQRCSVVVLIVVKDSAGCRHWNRKYVVEYCSGMEGMDSADRSSLWPASVRLIVV